MPNQYVTNTRDAAGFDGTGLPPEFGDGGGDNSGEGAHVPDYRERLRRCRLGLAVGLVPVAMLFVAFTSAYLIRQSLSDWDSHSNAYIRDWIPVRLPLLLMVMNTLILALSSVSMELARRQVMRESLLAPLASIPGVAAEDAKQFPWLAVTAILGIGFLAGQFLVWRELAARGFYMASGPSSQFVHILTGAHAAHLIGGVVALLFAVWATWRERPVANRRIAVDITAWYWHFMGGLWIYIFALLQFVK